MNVLNSVALYDVYSRMINKYIYSTSNAAHSIQCRENIIACHFLSTTPTFQKLPLGKAIWVVLIFLLYFYQLSLDKISGISLFSLLTQLFTLVFWDIVTQLRCNPLLNVQKYVLNAGINKTKTWKIDPVVQGLTTVSKRGITKHCVIPFPGRKQTLVHLH